MTPIPEIPSGLTDEEAANYIINNWMKDYHPVLGPWRLRPLRWLATAAVEWKPEDLWIGAFWKRAQFDGFHGISLWICILPCLPLHIWWYRRDVKETEE